MGDITVGKWLTVTGDVSGTGVKHQCKITYDNNSGDASTPPFNWPVMGDFTVILENRITSTGVLEAVDQNIDLKFEASVDGDNYFELYEEANVLDSPATQDAHIYDFDSKGLFPHMRVTLDPDAALGASPAHDVYVTIITHHMV
mgnify:CR=1 FL=1|tara:strand:+ start:698 stop:1129 length:432 start_codon:yes stop_codon:yes gene_type:complete